MRNFPEYKDPEQLDPEIVERLPVYRDYLGHPVTITAGYEATGHSNNSEHGETIKGDPNSMAVDCKSDAPLWWQFVCACRAGFENIGCYPEWNGLHLGVRGSEARRWIGLGSGKDQVYEKFTEENFKKYVLKI